jgi:RHS repeat-associated protein
MNALRGVRAVFLLAAVLSALGIGAAQPEKPPHGQGKYLLVLWEPGTPVPGKPDERMKKVPEPDLEKLGGRLLAKQANRRVVYLPYQAAKQLRKHQAVAYVQRIWTGEPFPEWNEADTGPTSLRAAAVETNADPSFTWDREYAYDADGNITSIGNDQFGYDDMGRLTAATVAGSSQSYAYDDFGNLTSVTRPGTTAVTVPTDPMTNRLIGETYDAAGNVTSRKARGTYVYDALNMIVEVGMTPGISRRRMLYDANDERIGVLIDSMLQRWTIRDFDGQILREFTGYDNGLNLVWSWEQDHVRGEGQLIAGETVTWQYNNDANAFTYGGKRHYHLDHLGSVRVVTNQAGKALSEHDFYPFGTPRTKQHQEELVWGQPHEDGMRFAGHRRDFMGPQSVEDDEYVDSMHARYYDPNLGRFLSVDPFLDTAKSMQAPQMWNRYSYVTNNPLRYTDPTGKAAVKIWGKGIYYVLAYSKRQGEKLIATIIAKNKKQVLQEIKPAIREARNQGSHVSVVTQTNKQTEGLSGELSANGRSRGPEKHGTWPTHHNPESGEFKDVHVQTLSDTKKAGFGQGLLSIIGPTTMTAVANTDASPSEIVSAVLWDSAKAIDPIFLTDALEYATGLDEYAQPPDE